ncbi:MAG TPA: PAS domain-containing protein [Lacunisphaera sp.]|nr:PAS domain-containing protein [Lacunisphaera sp.]
MAFYLVGSAVIVLAGILAYVLARSRSKLTESIREKTNALREELATRQEAETQLRRQYALLHAVTEGTSDSVFVKDREGKYLMMNSAGAAYLGRSVEAILGKTDADLFSAEAAAASQANDRLVVESGQLYLFEELGDATGSTRTYQSTKAPWRDSDGRIIGVIGISRDVTEVRKAERQLRQNEATIRGVFAAAPVGIGILQERVIQVVNRWWCDRFGYAEKELIGRSTRILYDDDAEFNRVGQSLYDGLHGTGVATVESRMRSRDGTLRDVVLSAAPLVSHDPSAGTVAIIHDITERKRAEAAVRELNASLERRVTERTHELAISRDRAEAADRVKSAFLATMSHELRTPLNSIIGFTGILLQGLAGGLNPEQTRQLEMVRDSARHLLALINDVLDISKIEADQLQIQREPMAVEPSAAKVAAIVRPLADRKGLVLHVSVAPDIGSISSDPRRVEQILLNLLNNAVKFTERGEVSFRVWRETNREPNSGTEPKTRSTAPFPLTASTVVRFEVRDTGIGIKSEHIPTLFQPFRQIDSGLTRQHEGTGLGLAICRRLADLLDGEITVQSEWNRGSVFTFTVPAN